MNERRGWAKLINNICASDGGVERGGRWETALFHTLTL